MHFKPVREETAIWVACEGEANRLNIDVPEHDLDTYLAEPTHYEWGVKPVLTGYFPAFEGAKMKALWAGLYSYNTVEFLPVAFMKDNFVVVGGGSASGITKGDSLRRIADVLYREEEEALLYGDRPYRVSKIGFDSGDSKTEEWVI